MRKFASLVITAFLLWPLAPSSFAAETVDNTRLFTVFIANYDRDGNFTGWGSGFFVDEGIVITNKHVIEGGQSYRIFSTGGDGTVDLSCYKDIQKSDVKINLEDDIAYIRVFINCPHGIVQFASADPGIGAKVSVIGYPHRGTVSDSLELSMTTGSVTGQSDGPWFKTNAFIHFGNSGGPVVHNDRVVGVAVAKAVDREGNYITGLFVPVSVVRKGLAYANNSTFGYTPQDDQEHPAYTNITFTPVDPFNPQRSGHKASNIACVESLGSGGEATGAGGCRCRASYHKDPTGKMCLPGAEARKNPQTFRTPVKDPAASKRQRLRVREAAKSVKIYVKKRGM